MAQRFKIFNGQIITPEGIIQRGTVIIEGTRIVEVAEGDILVENAIVIDAEGKYVSPGFIDIHLHGGGNCDFMDADIDSFLKIAETHARYGTTSMLPTTLTSEKDELVKTLNVFDEANKKNSKGAQFLGIHLEGPYFSYNQRGAQDPAYLRDPDPAEYQDLLALSKVIKRWSAAPELKGAMEFGRYLVSKGVIPSIAHTDAIYEDVEEAFKNGYSLITHLYSGMSGVTRRNAFRFAGVVESAFIIDDMNVEIIADGIHLPAPLLKLIYKIKGPDRIALITDSMRAAGMPPGESILGSLKKGQKVIVEDGVAKLMDRTAFAGSVATADRLVRNMINLAGVSLFNSVKMITATPARIMGIEKQKGSLVAGKDADLVIFDDQINIEKTFVNGKLVYTR